MPKKLAGVAVGVAVCLSGVAQAQQGPDYAALAEKLVGTNAGVKEGHVVWIIGGPLDTQLAEELAVAVRKRGGHPIVQDAGARCVGEAQGPLSRSR